MTKAKVIITVMNKKNALKSTPIACPIPAGHLWMTFFLRLPDFSAFQHELFSLSFISAPTTAAFCLKPPGRF